ncbi:glycerate kinase [Cellulomonas sp. KRMCY2]|uniref:glycerate kinase family protein n=1 Tax=Cellulomonas sp. KRMCY2 TaxID=1304865 RepID=UPI00045E643A|nr:glycerate kinase [Cellulomonas sp. KRMCY2]
MRILVAPDCFTGTLTARQAADAIADGWSRGAPHDDVTVLPLADGGPGFVETVHAGLGGELVPITVGGPLGEPTAALVLLVDGPSGRAAYLESAHAVGLHLVPAARRDPTRTTSIGVGELLRAALDLGARRVVVGLGGSATNDAGAGMLAGLGVGGLILRGGGGGLGGVRLEDLAGLAELRRELAGVDLVIATDVDVPLLGLHGASAGFAAQKGATAEQAQELERALGSFAQVVGQAVAADGTRRDLLAAPARPASTSGALIGSPLAPEHGGHHHHGAAGGDRTLAQLPGGGAAGGLGFGLAVLGGRVLPGAQVVAESVGLAEHVARSDIVVTGEGALDWQSLHGKVVSAVAAQGVAHGIPVVVVAGQVLIGRREWSAAGIAAAYAVAERPDQVAAAQRDPVATLAARAERVARTWSR